MELSLIIPIYNCEKTLPKSLESIRQQTFSDFEVLLVNDGSNDSSGIICEKLAHEDTRFKVIHKLNGGASSARNAGINASTGNWIVFMDADDEIGDDYLEELYNNRCENGVTVAGFYENNNGKVTLSVDFRMDKTIFNNDSRFQLFDNETFLMHPSPIAKIFDAEIIRKYNVRFNEDIQLQEDLLFWADFLLFAKYVKVIGPVHYYYLKDNSTLTKRELSFKSADALCKSFLKRSDQIMNELNKSKSDFLKMFESIMIFEAVMSISNSSIPLGEQLKHVINYHVHFSKHVKRYYKPTTKILAFEKWLFIYLPFLLPFIKKI